MAIFRPIAVDYRQQLLYDFLHMVLVFLQEPGVKLSITEPHFHQLLHRGGHLGTRLFCLRGWSPLALWGVEVIGRRSPSALRGYVVISRWLPIRFWWHISCLSLPLQENK